MAQRHSPAKDTGSLAFRGRDFSNRARCFPPGIHGQGGYTCWAAGFLSPAPFLCLAAPSARPQEDSERHVVARFLSIDLPPTTAPEVISGLTHTVRRFIGFLYVSTPERIDLSNSSHPEAIGTGATFRTHGTCHHLAPGATLEPSPLRASPLLLCASCGRPLAFTLGTSPSIRLRMALQGPNTEHASLHLVPS
jgi:hypothetical protein